MKVYKIKKIRARHEGGRGWKSKKAFLMRVSTPNSAETCNFKVIFKIY